MMKFLPSQRKGPRKVTETQVTSHIIYEYAIIIGSKMFFESDSSESDMGEHGKELCLQKSKKTFAVKQN